MHHHVALYGNTVINRTYCEQCQQWSIVIGRRKVCCNEIEREVPTCTKRLSEPEERRVALPAYTKEKLLMLYDYSCAYCCKSYGAIVLYKNEPTMVTLSWDHAVPFSFSYDNRPTNYLPACQICNAVKGNKMFNTIEEVQEYVQARIKKSNT